MKLVKYANNNLSNKQKNTESQASAPALNAGAEEEDRASWGSFAGGPGAQNGFSVGPDGFLYGKYTKVQGGWAVVPVKIGIQGLIPLKILVAKNVVEGDATNYITLYFIIKDIEKTITIPHNGMRDLKTGKGDAMDVTNAGFTIPAKQRDAEIFADLVQRMYIELDKNNALEVQKCDALPGWNDKGEHIRPGHECYIGNDIHMALKSGNFKNWKRTIKALLSTNKRLVGPFCFAIAGYLKDIVWETNITPILNLYGEGGKGKTTILQYLASIQTKPHSSAEQSIILQGSSTYVGFERALQNNNNGFVCFDELGTLAREYNALNNLMKLCNNGNRQKAKGKIYRWNNTIIATSNFNIVDALSKGDEMHEALASRIVEIDIDSMPIIQQKYKPSKMQRILTRLGHNYGHAYPIIIQKIAENKSKYLKMHYDFLDKINEHIFEKQMDLFNNKLVIDKNATIVMRTIQYYSMCNIALYILKEILEIEEKSDLDTRLKYGLAECFNGSFQKYNKEDNNDKYKSELTQFFYSNLSKFEWEGPLLYDLACANDCNNNISYKEQLENAQQHNKNIKQKWGCFVLNKDIKTIEKISDIQGRLYIYKQGEQFALKEGLNLEIFAKKAKKEGWLKTQKSGNRDLFKVMFKRIGTRCYCFNIDFAGKESNKNCKIDLEKLKQMQISCVEDIPEDLEHADVPF